MGTWELLRYVLGPHFGRSTSSQRIFGDVNYPISSTGLIPCGSCTEPHGKSIRRKKRQPLSLPDVHKTQDVCELGATVLPFVRSLFCAASRGPTPCRTRGFCKQKDLHGLTLRHKCLRSKLQLHLDPLSTKGEAASLETSHAVAKMTQPVKVNFLSAAF